MTDTATTDQDNPTPVAPSSSAPEAPETNPTAAADEAAKTADEPASGLLGDPEGSSEAGGQQEADTDDSEAVQYDLTLPEGADFDEGYIDRAKEAAKELGLSPEAAQKLVERDHAESTRRTEARQSLLADTWKQYRSAIKADPDMGGSDAKMAETERLATKALRSHFPELEPILSQYPHLRHPALIKGLRSIGSRMGESNSFVSGTKAPAELSPVEQWQRDFPNSPVPDSLRSQAGA